MKKFITIALVLLSLSSYAQEEKGYRIEGNKVVKVHKSKTKAEPIATDLIYTDSKGIDYVVYKTSRGAYFINRVSKNTNKEYKQYLKINN